MEHEKSQFSCQSPILTSEVEVKNRQLVNAKDPWWSRTEAWGSLVMGTDLILKGKGYVGFQHELKEKEPTLLAVDNSEI